MGVGLRCVLLVLACTASCSTDAPGDTVPVDAVDSSGRTPLMSAAAHDDPARIASLLAAGADLDASGPEGLRAWHLAAMADAVEALHALRVAGADLAVRSTNGMNTLEHAAASGSVETLEYLIDEHPDLDARSEAVSQGHGYPVDRGSTALGLATRAGEIETARVLIDAGANVDATSTSGNTPLLIAVFANRSPALVSLLLDAGADPTITVSCTQRCSEPRGDALTWARRLGRDELVALLRSATG